jgi:hypothetical protein
MVAPTCFGITLPSSGSVPSAFWEMLNWGAVDRILWMGVLCLVTWCVAIWRFSRIFLLGILILKVLTARCFYKSFGLKGLKYSFQGNINKILSKRENEIQNNAKHCLYWEKYLWRHLHLFLIGMTCSSWVPSSRIFLRRCDVPANFQSISVQKRRFRLHFNYSYLQCEGGVKYSQERRLIDINHSKNLSN